jgi:hypothetical protein
MIFLLLILYLQALAPCLQFLGAAFALAQNPDLKISRTGKVYVRLLLPNLLVSILARARRVYLDPTADAASVHVDAFLQVATLPSRSLEDSGLVYFRMVILALVELLAPSNNIGDDSYNPMFASQQSKLLHLSVVQALVRLAVEDPARFRSVVETFNGKHKTKLQTAMAGGQRKPTIALKSFS